MTSSFLQSEIEELLVTRRLLHRHPELKFEEFATAQLVAERLRRLGLEPKEGIAGTGVVAVLRPDLKSPALVLRADMDALPVDEQNDVEYRSARPGLMHACGHDGHTATLLAVARRLLREQESLRCPVKLVFQPGEEGGRGALKMIEEGVLSEPAVEGVFGFHLWNGLETGKIGVVDGALMASVDEFEVRVYGKGGHGAIPQQTIDPVLVSSHIVTALQSIVSRSIDPLDSAVVTVGCIRAGDTFNVIPETALLKGTVRTFSPEVYNTIPKIFERVVRSTAAAFGATVEIDYERQCRPTINNREAAAFVRRIATELVGSSNVVTDNRARTMAGEDMSFFLERVPGCFFFVGSRNEARGFVYPHHSPNFDFDEDALVYGAEMMRRIALEFPDLKGVSA